MKRQKNEDYHFLMNHIPEGCENAVHMSELSVRLGVSERRVRSWVHDAKAAGFTILSDNRGYWQSEKLSEIKRSHARHCNMARSILHAETPTRRLLNSTEGQLDLFDSDTQIKVGNGNEESETAAES